MDLSNLHDFTHDKFEQNAKWLSSGVYGPEGPM